MTRDPSMTRRRFGALGLGALAWGAGAQQPQQQPAPYYMGDMHSHLGMFRPRLGRFDMKKHLQETGTMLIAWAATDDHRWIASDSFGLHQTREPAPGELWASFQNRIAGYEAQLKDWQLPKALVPADIDAALAGTPHVLLSTEAASFLEGQPERVAQAHAWGVRHLQMMHFIRNPLGDFQTEKPRFNGITPAGRQVIAECKRLGIVVDLAHGTPDFVDGALESDAVMLWSHSWISPHGGTWTDYANTARSLSQAQAKKIAAHGGLVGLWTVRAQAAGYPVRDVKTFADEMVRMCDLLGPEHVAFGTDMEGAGTRPILSDYADLREVADNLVKRGLPESTLQAIFIGNYANIVKRAMNGATKT